MKISILSFCILILCFSCTVAPQKIEYGKDACHFCKMTIVDKTHAAQTVTKKGKAFKYDAIECMINDLASKKESEFAYLLVTNFSTPEILINASEAIYLISPEIKSPMGVNLSAFKENEKASYFKGTQYNWKTIKNHLNHKK